MSWKALNKFQKLLLVLTDSENGKIRSDIYTFLSYGEVKVSSCCNYLCTSEITIHIYTVCPPVSVMREPPIFCCFL